MATADDYYWDILEEPDSMNEPITEWESDLLENTLSHKEHKLISRQKEIVEKMKERYLV